MTSLGPDDLDDDAYSAYDEVVQLWDSLRQSFLTRVVFWLVVMYRGDEVFGWFWSFLHYVVPGSATR